MHLSVKNDEAQRLAIELARLTGWNRTPAVTLALRERPARRASAPRRSRHTVNRVFQGSTRRHLRMTIPGR